MSESHAGDIPFITRELSDRTDRINMTKVRAKLYLSGERPVYVEDRDAWAFPLGTDTDALHHFGPLFQAAGTAEKFSYVRDLTDFTTGESYSGYRDVDDVVEWIESKTRP